MVSLGVDAAADDPESPLRVTPDGYREAGAILGALGLPTVVVQEGGYHLRPSAGWSRRTSTATQARPAEPDSFSAGGGQSSRTGRDAVTL